VILDCVRLTLFGKGSAKFYAEEKKNKKIKGKKVGNTKRESFGKTKSGFLR
jgi:hypothetical protein